MILRRLLCTFHLHAWNRCTCGRCGLVRDEYHEAHQCRCRICGREVHKFVEADSDLHSCRECGRSLPHEMEPFSETREVPGMWTSDMPYFVHDVSGSKCRVCRYERIDYASEPR